MAIDWTRWLLPIGNIRGKTSFMTSNCGHPKEETLLHNLEMYYHLVFFFHVPAFSRQYGGATSSSYYTERWFIDSQRSYHGTYFYHMFSLSDVSLFLDWRWRFDPTWGTAPFINRSLWRKLLSCTVNIDKWPDPHYLHLIVLHLHHGNKFSILPHM